MATFNNRPNFPQEEEKLVAKWKKNKTFEKSVEQRPESKSYSFYDGPPFATGLPHYGHLLQSLVKDMVPRYKAMNGYRVERRWGWDCHGLPIENIVEKELDLNSRKDILEYGVDKFNNSCHTKILEYADDWQKTITRFARWVDMDNDYKTMDLGYMDSVWWVFKSLWDQDLIYRGRKSMHICPRCETVLSNFEVAENYQDAQDQSVIWKFPLTDEKNTFLLAWTTTPWSTPSTMGLAIGKDFDYVKVQVKDEYLILAKARLEFVVGDTEHNVVEEFKGSRLVGTSYEPILPSYKELPEVKRNKNVYHVYHGDHVEVEEGTGIVTINGSYGEVDAIAAGENDLPIVMDVDITGKFNDKSGVYAGMYVKDGEKKLIKDMEDANRVWRDEPYVHSYPHCWRCDTPLLNYNTTSWFVAVTKLKKDALKSAKEITWTPAHVKVGRFGKWLEDAKDWAISRSRYWGTPLPIWQNVDDESDVICIGGKEELEELSGKKVSDLHKHIIDDITITKDGKTYKRIDEVLDCWFESGSMPYAQSHYPHEDPDGFMKKFPADFIAEAQDQTTRWFYVLHILATALTSGTKPALPVKKVQPAFKNVVVSGMILAEDGKKMSKKLQNYPEPDILFDKYGADSVRYYIATSPVLKMASLNFSERGVSDVFRKMVLTLWNVVSFYKLFDDEKKRKVPAKPAHVLDVWLLAKLEQLKAEVTEGYESYDLNKATRPINDFVQELSTWYIRRSRDRFKVDGKDKEEALAVLGEVLRTLSLLMAPIMPFMADMVYEVVGGENESVHLDDWPKHKKLTKAQTELIDEMRQAQGFVELIHAARKDEGIKVRQPLSAVSISEDLPQNVTELIRDEVNVKEVLYKDMKYLIPETTKLTRKAGAVGEILLNTALTPELEEQGLVREIIRQVNSLRKEAKLTLDDRVDLVYSVASGDSDVFDRHKDVITQQTLSSSLAAGQPKELQFSTVVAHGDQEVHLGFNHGG